eukprot:TRINITY_DN38144_c0_g1_i1.p1 TRINITY_DN38144_c0_g1~~TRINITY_DN38144_c0_g1_i1.p1  ORF type:complete len:857 (+),score=126.03 TRINITY_DN38144_c0_g1_i1:41-2611(+)
MANYPVDQLANFSVDQLWTGCFCQNLDTIFPHKENIEKEAVGDTARLTWFWVSFGFCLAIILSTYMFHWIWQSRSSSSFAKTTMAKEIDVLSSQLACKFMPSVAVQTYRFCGMRPKTSTISIKFEDLSLVLHDGKTVLKGVTGEFKAKTMVAIMGPSGAGKTTFMNVLCGKAPYGKRHGKVLINGQEGDISQFKSVVGFVPQEDVVHEMLTVREQIHYAAELRNACGTPRAVINAIVQDVLRVMQIDHIETSIVGGVKQRGISGGQRKRVNIGLELAACPTVLFLDEPTTGLDSTSSLLVISSLKKMTTLGMTTIMVIHQPRYSLFTLFDEVLLLGRGGQTVYLGGATSATGYFENLGFKVPTGENLADWLMDVISGEVETSREPSFKPVMLFDWWEKHVSGEEQQVFGKRRSESNNSTSNLTSNEGRDWGKLDDQRCLEGIVEVEWAKIVTDGDNVMGIKVLQHLLHNLGLPTTAELAEKLMKRMSTSGELTVTKAVFTEFLRSQCSVIGEMSRLSERASADGMAGAYQAAVDVQEIVDDHVTAISRFFNPHDASSDLQRTRPGFMWQLRVISHRRLVQFWRRPFQRLLDICFVSIAAVALGRNSARNKSQLIMPTFLASFIFSLLIAVSVLNTFADKTVFWRESASGVNTLAFFGGRIIVSTLDWLFQTFAFTTVWYFCIETQEPFENILVPFLCVAFCASGWGTALSTLVQSGSATLATTALMVVLSGLLGLPDLIPGMNWFVEVMIFFSPPRWCVQMVWLAQLEGSGGVAYPERSEMGCSQSSIDSFADDWPMKSIMESMTKEDFVESYKSAAFTSSMGSWGSGMFCLCFMGVLMRVIGYLALKFVNKSKQI